MMQQGKLKRCPCGAALDMVAVDFEGCIALLEAVQVAVDAAGGHPDRAASGSSAAG